MSNQEPSTDSTASGANKPASEGGEAQTIEGQATSSDSGQTFPLVIYKPQVQYRFIQLAASVAIAAALGGLIGAVSAYGFAKPKTDPAEPTHNLEAALARVTKDVAALKTSIESSNRTTASQIAKLGDRFDRGERAQADPAAKIAALNESLARIEKRLANPPAPAKTEAAADITGSIPDRTAIAKDQSKPPIVEGWVLRDVQRGRALVEHRDTLYLISRGADLPGVGRVENITRQNGRWVVVTAKGLIVSMR
jgi:hypothetical protein